MNEEKKRNRKDWIKNIAIIFLAIMLVLTFFSNTIMNYSLPEVATATVESGTVTAKIRGTGTLVSDDPYKVTIQESRVIASVAVKEGDTVEKDQVLFYLEEKESEELIKAEAELEALVLTYSTTLLAGEISNQSYQNIQSGNISSAGDYQARIAAAKQKVTDAQDTVDSLTRQLTISSTESGDTIDKNMALENAKTALQSAESGKAAAEQEKTAAKARLDALESENSKLGSLESLQSAVNSAVTEEGTKKVIFDNAELKFFTRIDSVNGSSRAGSDEFATQMISDSNYVGKLSQEIEALSDSDPSDIPDASGTGYLSKRQAAVKELQDLQEAYKNYLTAQDARKAAEQAVTDKSGYTDRLNAAQTDYNNASTNYNNAKNRYDECLALVNSLSSQVTANTADQNKQKADLTLRKADAEAALAAAKNDLTQLLTDVSKELNLSSQSSQIKDKQEEVARLREKATGSTIVAPIAGTITSISKTAGETTVPEDALAVMQPEGKGYSLSFSVTNDQAQKVSVGDVAELQNSWYYGDIKATLSSIRPDTENPGQKKLLKFDVTGEVQAGQSISLSVGQRSASYNLVVPNSAVREDKNGKFILIVESKNSPLGNRYVATRVDVEVLASDDLNTAINAALYGYEYVITTSTKPVEAGKQIRLADN
ncbi:MAG: HlyD family efflux transporter periplasmic adaptor subunit [Lachnospiraceae bacterium]|nr:HlyD family efflux transporter periplasmic adaptor subunit [Lachnospiraceae bacterium]MCI7596089.1 HlyD family efflux transporter periplasmic adaptor subunit [Lachnospiraceae bacterium]MDD7049767.1 HlyD family efflux transporter periplasmic adaptor subunit [Lachnospiraceae bacterium]MDY3222374.1 HlyD family efflux transporter periplasmic adaptor subunit [Lachnospiraceae bacterium]MDY4095770.1 HlyD family efflux transporter periplasmic adaptor subunit [Lachnospiraceae bacterium]